MSPAAKSLPGLETLLRALPVGVVLLDGAGQVLLYNEAAARISGRRPEEVEGRDFFEQTGPWPEVRGLHDAFRRAMDGSAESDEREATLSTADGPRDVRFLLQSITLSGQPHAVVVVADNTRFKATERALGAALGKAQDEAVRDPLTGLFNRRHLEAMLPGEIGRSERLKVPLSLFVIDVDHFKSINDRFGHPMGDRVLVELARLMHRILRVGDTCARLGGEEFCVVLPHTDPQAAQLAAERLHRVIRALRFEEEPGLRVRVSIGATTARAGESADDHADKAKQLIARADEAVYEAKRSGRDRTVYKD